MTDFYISDTHFGHPDIIDSCSRPFLTVEEMDRALISNWNARVSPVDHVWILGDLVYERHPDPGRYLECLNGKLHLVLGEHDLCLMRVDPDGGGFATTEFQPRAELRVLQ